MREVIDMGKPDRDKINVAWAMSMAEHIVAVHRDAEKTAREIALEIGLSEDWVSHEVSRTRDKMVELGYHAAVELPLASGIDPQNARWVQANHDVNEIKP
jgi:DNA-binding Lrp family transcriptional regulator